MSSDASLETLFETVAQRVRQPNDNATSDSSKLQLYGLYKHVREGPCSGENPSSLFQGLLLDVWRLSKRKQPATREKVDYFFH